MKINNNDQVVILAGGYGKRLGLLTKKKPKSLLTFNSKTFIFHQIKYFQKKGIKNFLILIGHDGEKIKKQISKYKFSYLNVDFSHDGKKNIGTGGALKKAKSKLFKNFFLIYGDTFPQINILKLKEAHLKKTSKFTMCIYRNNDKYDKSNIILKNKKISKYSKSLTNAKYIDYGVSMLNKSIILSSKKSSFDLKNIINQLLTKNLLNYFIVKKRFYEIGSFEGIKQFKSFININEKY